MTSASARSDGGSASRHICCSSSMTTRRFRSRDVDIALATITEQTRGPFQVPPGVLVVRCKRRRRPEVFNRLCEFPLACQPGPQQIVSHGIVRLETERLPGVTRGFVSLVEA